MYRAGNDSSSRRNQLTLSASEQCHMYTQLVTTAIVFLTAFVCQRPQRCHNATILPGALAHPAIWRPEIQLTGSRLATNFQTSLSKQNIKIQFYTTSVAII